MIFVYICESKRMANGIIKAGLTDFPNAYHENAMY